MPRKLKKFWVPLLGMYGFFVFMQITTWIPLRYWRIWGGGNFVDSDQVLRWADCYTQIGNAIFESNGVCSGYLYGSTLVRILNFLSLSPTNTQALGYGFMFFLAASIAYTASFFNNFKANPILFVIVISPPVLLLAERGNFDILMMLLVISASILFARDFQILALFPLALASLLKFYTLPLFVLFLILNRGTKRKIITALVSAIVFTRILLDFEMIESKYPSEFSGQFGASIWARYLKQLGFRDSGFLINHISGFVILVLVAVLTIMVLKRLNTFNLTLCVGQENERVVFYTIFGTHVCCYLSGMNIDYRLIFLFLASLFYLIRFSQQDDLDSRIILCLTVMSLWLSFPSPGLEPLGDLAIEVLTVILGVRFIQLIKQDLKVQNGQ